LERSRKNGKLTVKTVAAAETMSTMFPRREKSSGLKKWKPY
jgi:hypothetical protein